MDLITFSSIFFLLLSLFTFLLALNYFSTKRPSSHALKPYPLVGHVPQFIKNRHRYLDWTADIILSDPTRTMGFQNPFLSHGIITANPLNVEHLIKTNFANYPKGEFVTKILLQEFLGQAVTSSDDEQWKHQRIPASIEFNKKSIKSAVVDTAQWEIEKRLLPLLRRAEARGEVLDLQDIFECFGFDNICKLAFNEDPACLSIDKEEEEKMIMSRKAKKAFGDAQRLMMVRTMDAIPFIWSTMKMLDIGHEKKLRETVAIVHEFATKIVRKRKELKLNSDLDILSHFESEKDISDEFLRDAVIGYVLNGRDMISSALSWFFWLVSTTPEVEEKILKEVEEVRGMQGHEKLREMQYLHAALTETMRLYPPVALNTVECREDDVLPDGSFVGKGWFVAYHAYAMGRLEEIWGEDWGVFRPERWLEDGVFQPKSPFKYPVFHAGPRVCLGKEMAYIQMKSVAASVLEEFRVEVLLEKGIAPEHELQMTLRMMDGLPVQVKRRE